MELFWEALQDLTLIILIFAAFLSIAISMATEEEHRAIAWIEGFAILCAVFISAFVQAVNDYQKEKQFQALNEEAESNKKVNVIR
jgi:magnesium-transporting ATPase (P-type)